MPDFGFNDWIDAQLRNVPLPPGLLSRLADGGPPPSHPLDERIDAALRDVPVPADLQQRLRTITRRRRRVPLWRQVGVAAGLFGVLGLGIYAATRLSESPRSAPADDNHASDRVATSEPKSPAAPRSTQPRQAPPRPAASGPAVARQAPAASRPAPRVAKAEPRRTKTEDIAPAPVATKSADPAPATAAAEPTLKQSIEARQRAQSALGASGEFDPLPELDAMEMPTARGIVPPRAHGYDLLFHLRHGEHPFVSPAAHAELATVAAPMTLGTASFDLALRAAKAGQLPPADEVRVEDFLAAMDYALPPPPTAGAALHAAGCASPLGDGGLHMLQLTVQAAAKPRSHPPTRLIAVVDTSNGMRGAARFEAIQRALVKLTSMMTASDRLTLIGFAEQPRVLIEDATAEDLRAWLGSAMPWPAGSADFASAIQSACDAIRQTQHSQLQRVVFMTAGRGDFSQAAVGRSAEALAAMADAQIPWEIVRVAAPDDSQLAELAERGRGQVSSAASTAELYGVLLGKLVGEQPTVARRASLKITFNPKIVTGYRLLGHEARALTAPASDPLEIDLSTGQTVTNMFELWIKPGAEQVAVAELKWLDPATGAERRVRRPIRRDELTGSFSRAPAWVQQGVVAAKTAEALRSSYYLPATRPVGRILEMADQADPRITRRADFQALVSLLKLADKSR